MVTVIIADLIKCWLQIEIFKVIKMIYFDAMCQASEIYLNFNFIIIYIINMTY